MRTCLARNEAYIKCSKRNGEERRGGRETEMKGGEERRGRERIEFQLVSVTGLPTIAATPNAHGVTITHKGMAAIF